MIKNTAKAVIYQNEQVLLLEKLYDGFFYYTLPGGTQEFGESLEQAVVREAFEETGAIVSVNSLLAVYEHQRPSRKPDQSIRHQVEFAFLCDLIEEYSPAMGTHPDPHQIAVRWVAIKQLAELNLSPPVLAEILAAGKNSQPGYLGSVASLKR